MFELDEAWIRQRVAAGASVGELARDLGIDATAARQRLEGLGLQTARQRVLAEGRAARATGARTLTRACPAHGDVVHRIDARGSYRCPLCNADRVIRRRRSVKEILVKEAGGACALCGYDRCVRALSFHHLDPTDKAFGLAVAGVARSLERARAEASKCVLLCANCHMEVEAGLRSVALHSEADRG